MYGSTYKLTLDERDRMRIPSKLRAKYSAGADIYLMQGTDSSLFLVTEEEIKINFGLKDIPLSDSDAQNALRAVMGNVYLIEEDSQGRFVLPECLKTAGDIQKKVVFLCMEHRVEVWSEEKYAENAFGAKGAVNKALALLKEKGYAF